ncbi:hypothetical protein RND71_039351 [Anisodus tanguticus]|uniref:2-phosphoglycerate kinase n=1 Tax=Anisodus tanguticus TaxID=243964 RepID=A0AAE1QWA0_9SOLA|nr:hypothetical protein RND71_039351 [Anisodus tanguticus]
MDMKKKEMGSTFISKRNDSSKYDFVKVKVWLGDNDDHYYVLSRFLLSRMLIVTKIPNHVAVKIALDLKKLLVDNSLLDVSQADLEANLFKLMERRGFGEEFIKRYKMMTSFHHQRVPLVILVCGTACVGKSTIATQLAQRLNLPNVLQTEMVHELLRTSTDAPLASSPVWARDFSSSEELITEFCRECRIIWKGLAGDLRKATKDGKPIIIEGIHLDPRIFLMEEEHRLLPPPTADHKEPNFSKIKDHEEIQRESNHSTGLGSQTDGKDCYAENVSSEGAFSELDKLTDSLKSKDIVEKTSENAESEPPNKFSDHTGETVIDSGPDQNPAHGKQTLSDQPIFVPIVLRMADFDHQAFLEEWVATRTFREKHPAQDKDKVITNLMTIQDYLCSFTSQGLTVVDVSAETFPQTLDWLHNYLLQIGHGLLLIYVWKLFEWKA